MSIANEGPTVDSPEDDPPPPVRTGHGDIPHENAGSLPSAIDALLPAELRRTVPPLYATEQDSDPVVQAKLFTPWTSWTWYVLEFDGVDRAFGWVVGFEAELGYFSLAELAAVRGPWGVRIERDKHFAPKPLRQVQAEHPLQPDPPSGDQVRESDEDRPPPSPTEPIDMVMDPFVEPAIQLAETWLRAVRADCALIGIETPRDAAGLIRRLIGQADREHFVVLFLGAKGTVTHAHVVSRGTLTSSLVHPREVFKGAILANAASIIVGHNHPSGGLEPSQDDLATESRLRRCGDLLGIPVIDAMIVGPGEGYYSASAGGEVHADLPSPD